MDPIVMEHISFQRLKLEYSRFQARHISVKYAVAGAYFGFNLGDNALRDGFIAESKRIQPAVSFRPVITSDLGSLKAPRAIVLGGGAIGLPDVIENLRKKYKHDPHRVAIFGVDFSEKALCGENREFLRDIPFVSCRFSDQADMVREQLGRQDVRVVWDLAFHHQSLSQNQSPAEGSNDVGINVVAFLSRMTSSGFEDHVVYPGGDHYTRNRGRELAAGYRSMMRKLVEKLLYRGCHVKHLPFSPTDDAVARRIFDGLPVEYTPFSPSVPKMIETMSALNRIYTSRLHSLVLSLIAGTCVSPFFYSTKCKLMAKALGLELSQGFHPGMLLNMSADEGAELMLSSSQGVPDFQLAAIRDSLHQSVHECLSSVNLS